MFVETGMPAPSVSTFVTATLSPITVFFPILNALTLIFKSSCTSTLSLVSQLSELCHIQFVCFIQDRRPQ